MARRRNLLRRDVEPDAALGGEKDESGFSGGTLLFAVTGCATTIHDDFTGCNACWHPLGHSHTATYDETFTAPTNGDTGLQSFGFYMAGPVYSDNIVMSSYVATWTGS